MTRDELDCAVLSGKVSHTRAGDRLYRGSILVYGHDDKSPTGVTLLGVVPDEPEFASVLRGGLAPLSPSEPR